MHFICCSRPRVTEEQQLQRQFGTIIAVDDGIDGNDDDDIAVRNTVSSVDDVVEADIAHVESIQMVTQTIKLLITPSLSPTSLRLIPGSCNDSDRCSSCV